MQRPLIARMVQMQHPVMILVQLRIPFAMRIWLKRRLHTEKDLRRQRVTHLHIFFGKHLREYLRRRRVSHLQIFSRKQLMLAWSGTSHRSHLRHGPSRF